MKTILGRLIGITALAFAVPAHAVTAPVGSDIPIALLLDLSSGQTLFERQAARRFVPASVTKVMTAFTAFQLLKAGELTEEQRFTFSETAAEDWYRTGSTMFLDPGAEASVSELLMAITTVSANDGSIVLAEGASGSVENWLRLMNENAAQLGMRQSHFGTPNGWPDGGRTFTTARDLILLGTALVEQHPRLYAKYFGHRGLRTNGIAQDNHDPISGRLEGADGIKTGYTNQAGFNFLGSAIRGDRRLMMVLAGAPEEPIRDAAARALMEWGFSNFKSTRLFGAGERVGVARVQDGVESNVPLVAENTIRFATPNGADRDIALTIRYEGPLRAPITKGERVAQLELRIDGMAPSYIPLIAAEDIGRAGFLRRIANAFAGAFG